MKKPLTMAAVTLLATSLSFAQSWTGVLKQKATSPSVKTTRVKTSTQKGGLGDKVSLNPQPLPPKQSTAKINSRASKVSLNPQPLPPKTATSGIRNSPGSKVSLNPQPLPPKQSNAGVNSRASKVSLNPQPLPPKTATSGIRDSPGSKVSLNPQPLPPKVAHSASQTKIRTKVQKTAPIGANNAATQR